MTEPARTPPDGATPADSLHLGLGELAQRLPSAHLQALLQANAVIIDCAITSLEERATGMELSALELVQILPAVLVSQCSEQVVRRLLLSFIVTGQKLVEGSSDPLGSIAEEIALLAMVHVATLVLETQGEEAQFDRWLGLVGLSPSVRAAFDRSPQPGDARMAQHLREALPTTAHWFTPLAAGNPVHPYLEQPD